MKQAANRCPPIRSMPARTTKKKRAPLIKTLAIASVLATGFGPFAFAPAHANVSGGDGKCASISNLQMLSDSAATISAGVLGESGVLSRESIRSARDSARLAARGTDLAAAGGVGGFAGSLAQSVVEIGDAILEGDWLVARELASDPSFKAKTRAVQGYVNSRCSDAEGGGDATAGEGGEGGGAPVRSLGGAEGIGDVTRVFASQSATVKFGGLLMIIVGLMVTAHGIRFAYDVLFALIFRRISCFIPCTLQFGGSDGRKIGGRITILDRRGVGFEPNLLHDAAFVANADFYETCTVKIGKREFTLKLLLYYPERMAFDFDAPLTFSQHRALLGLTMVPASLSVRPPIDRSQARHVMEKRKAEAAPSTRTPKGEGAPQEVEAPHAPRPTQQPTLATA